MHLTEEQENTLRWAQELKRRMFREIEREEYIEIFLRMQDHAELVKKYAGRGEATYNVLMFHVIIGSSYEGSDITKFDFDMPWSLVEYLKILERKYFNKQ